MQRVIDKSRVTKAFHTHAACYDRHATVQQRVVQQLQVMIASHSAAAPKAVLDVGCGTGRLLSGLHSQYPDAAIFGIDLAENMVCQSRNRLGDSATILTGDAENLPFGTGMFDLVVSTSTLQWLESLQQFINEAYRVLASGGLLCCAFFAGTTLHELHDCYRTVISSCGGNTDPRLDHLHRFHSLDEVNRAFQGSAFEQVVVSSELEQDQHCSLYELLRSIRSVGAGTVASAAGSRRGGLGWRSIMQEMDRLYHARYGCGGMIPVSYEVCYLVARKIS